MHNKVLSIVLVFAILAATGALVYVIAVPQVGERFTEFYILGPDGKAEKYPEQIALGEGARVMLGIVNREYEEVNYRVEVRIDGAIIKQTGPFVLAHEEKWEQEVSFILTKVGEDQKVEFVLYRHGQDRPYMTLHLWLEVREQYGLTFSFRRTPLRLN